MTQMTAGAARKSMRVGTSIPQPLGFLARAIARWQRRQRQRRDQTWLQSQPDYLLRDIGVSRAEIEGILRGVRMR
jgi:uncharacterized protein YjiS (DUF1127 family)